MRAFIAIECHASACWPARGTHELSTRGYRSSISVAPYPHLFEYEASRPSDAGDKIRDDISHI